MQPAPAPPHAQSEVESVKQAAPGRVHEQSVASSPGNPLESAENKDLSEDEAAESWSNRRGWGITLLVLGLGSFFLPLFGLQFRLMDLLRDAQPAVGIFFALIGGGLLGWSYWDNE